jgi:hypothetical protein
MVVKSELTTHTLYYFKLSITIADAPPPLQIAAAPIFALFCSNT